MTRVSTKSFTQWHWTSKWHPGRVVHLHSSSLEKNLLSVPSVWFCKRHRVVSQLFEIMPSVQFPQNDTVYCGTKRRKHLKTSSLVLESVYSRGQSVTWPLTVALCKSLCRLKAASATEANPWILSRMFKEQRNSRKRCWCSLPQISQGTLTKGGTSPGNWLSS